MILEIEGSRCQFDDISEVSAMSEYEVQLVKAYAKHLELHLNAAITSLCYGCSVNHGSQIEHNVCCMMEEHGLIEHCLQQCLQLIDETQVMNDFTSKLPINRVFGCPGMIYSADFRKSLWHNSDWVNTIVREIFLIRKSRRTLEVDDDDDDEVL